jgi:hypothetical protein
MKNRRLTLASLTAVIVLVVGGAWFALGPGEAPPGQPSLVALNSESLQSLRADFNREVGQTRVIVLLSPT